MTIDRLIGDSPPIRALREHVRRLVALDGAAPPPLVLIKGETGTGKGLLARIIHDGGPRAAGPFVAQNAAAIPETLLEAELFGFEAGAFTDARRAKPGLFEAAGGGTLFLDEIDALPGSLQGKLLTALDDRRIRRLGAVTERTVDVKVIAATKEDLTSLVAAGRFRADLFHRLAVLVIEVPPLRSRNGDAVRLARHFLEEVARAHRLAPRSLDVSAERWIAGHSWPGNVRELAHLMERCALLSDTPVVDAALLEQFALSPSRLVVEAATPAPGSPKSEVEAIRAALARTGGNVLAAARLLGLTRNALRYRLRRYRIVTVRPGALAAERSPQPTDRQRAASSAPASPEESAATVPGGEPESPGLVVGRSRELRRLEEALGRARAGQRAMAFVTGEPGVGKTTLIKAFCDGLRDRADVRVTRGQCIEQYGAGEPYLPVLEASERLAHTMNEPRLIDVLRQHAPTWAAQLPSLLPPSERQALQQELRGATQARMLREMSTAFERLTAERALVLCLEDLQWSDHATLALVAALARRPERARLLVLATYRPADALVGSPHLREVVDEIAVHGLGEVLPLAPLTVADLQEYLRRRFGHDPALTTLAAAVHRRTEGNPLFAITVIADLVAQGALQQREGGWDLSSATMAVRGTVPETVRQLIERQAIGLERIEQRLLEAGSVAGAEFSTAAVAAALGELPMELEARCADLVRRGLFLTAHEPVSSPDGTTSTRFAFRHALYQEILYGRVPPARRAELHRAIGTQLEGAHPDAAIEIATELATHFDRGGDAARAVRYLEHAGNAALANSSHHEAIRHLSRALDILPTLPNDRARTEREVALLLGLGPAWMAARGYAASEVGDTYARALARCRQLGETPQLFRTLRGLWNFHLVRAELDTARELSEELLGRAEKQGDPVLVLRAHAQLGQTLFHQGEIGRAQEHFTQVEAGRVNASAPPDPRVLAYGAWAAWYLGAPDDGRAAEALAVARRLRQPHELAFVLGFTGFHQMFRGDAPAVKALAEEEIVLCEEHGYPYWRAWGYMLRGWADGELGRGPAGAADVEKGIAQYRDTGAIVGFAHFLTVLVEALTREGRGAEALQATEEALGLVRRTGNRYHEPEVYRWRGELLAGAGGTVPRLNEAEEAFATALSLARDRRTRALELRAALSWSRLLVRRGRQAEATALLTPLAGHVRDHREAPELRAARDLLRSAGAPPAPNTIT
ncbi:MAG: sigma 54-interacting transcriptional regulator [Candidatus Rokuibacteriota bacterium]